MDFLDLIFPKRCVSCGKIGAYICRQCYRKIEFIDKPICPVCQRQAVGGKTHPGCMSRYSLDGLIMAAKYKGPVRAAILKVKYKFIYDIGKVLVELLNSQLYKYSLPNKLALIPIPLHLRRKNWRGFNQSEKFAEIMSRKFSVKASFDILQKIKNTVPQVNLSKKQRRENIKDAFVAKGVNAGDFFILVDDVFTSGATMAEACKTLKKSGAGKVWAMAIAKG